MMTGKVQGKSHGVRLAWGQVPLTQGVRFVCAGVLLLSLGVNVDVSVDVVKVKLNLMRAANSCWHVDAQI